MPRLLERKEEKDRPGKEMFPGATGLTWNYNAAPAHGASQVALVVKNLPNKAGDIGNGGWIPGWGRCPGGEHGNPLHYSCLENPMDRGAY